jgi:hypothetical protein
MRLYGLDWSGSGQGSAKGSYKFNNEHPRSIKCKEIVEYLHNRQLLKKGLAP